MNYLLVDVVNLSVLIIISFGMMIYVHQYCIDKERENKLKELAIAYALLKKEEQDREAESFKKEYKDSFKLSFLNCIMVIKVTLSEVFYEEDYT